MTTAAKRLACALTIVCIGALMSALIARPAQSAGRTHSPSPRNVADYIVIKDGTFGVPSFGRKAFSFTLPAGVRLDQYAVLSLMVDPRHSGDLEVQVNDKVVQRYNFGSDALRAVTETFDGQNILRPGAANSIEFRSRFVRNIDLSDVVLWFQRAVE